MDKINTMQRENDIVSKINSFLNRDNDITNPQFDQIDHMHLSKIVENEKNIDTVVKIGKFFHREFLYM